jgi:excinuclease ABC subunit C
MRIEDLPENAGVYVFKDANFVPIYVGKANNLRKRVRSHLRAKNVDPKGTPLLEKAKSVESFTIDSEIEALVLEANLIKKYKPYFNSQLKDGKDYLYIKITKDQFPKVRAARKRDLKDALVFFGPFPSASRVRSTLKTLRRIFPYSVCRPNQSRSCLHYHLGLCPGVCSGLIDERSYKSNINKIRLFLEGDKGKVLNLLEMELKMVVKNLEFEKASSIKSKIESINYITTPTRTFVGEDQEIEIVRKKEQKELANIVGLDSPPNRIECYDISNIGGKDATGSMVVFSAGVADRDEYRRFKIKEVKGINDTAMISEVLERRFKNNWKLPDLIIIDGGRGQLNAALEVIGRFDLSVKVISLAKRFEKIYFSGDKSTILLQRDNHGLRLIQRIRDEAHRFAITYHKKLRSKDFLTKEALFAKLKKDEEKTS